jgi:hypothetical protein
MVKTTTIIKKRIQDANPIIKFTLFEYYWVFQLMIDLTTWQPRLGNIGYAKSKQPNLTYLELYKLNNLS